MQVNLNYLKKFMFFSIIFVHKKISVLLISCVVLDIFLAALLYILIVIIMMHISLYILYDLKKKAICYQTLLSVTDKINTDYI